jgi:hypothetical protein
VGNQAVLGIDGVILTVRPGRLISRLFERQLFTRHALASSLLSSSASLPFVRQVLALRDCLDGSLNAERLQ